MTLQKNESNQQQQENLVLIKTIAQLKDLKHYIKDKDFIAWDTETNGVTKESKIIGFSLCAETHLGFYVVLSYWDVKTQRLVDLETMSHAKDFLSKLIGKNLIAHNAPFDCRMVESNFKISLIDSIHTDTLILAHLLDENRSNGLKELGASFYGQNATREQALMKDSVHKNGGKLTKDEYELYKADADLIGHYGAKDAILTLKLFYDLVPELYNQKLDKFFYDDESMPLLRGPTYEMNSVGLRIDAKKLQDLKGSLEAEIMELKSSVYAEILPHVKDKYPGTNKGNTFNINANQQMAWLLFEVLRCEFGTLTDSGREMCKALKMKTPYAAKDKRDFITFCRQNKGMVWEKGTKVNKSGKTNDKTVGDFWKYTSTDAETLELYSKRYLWVDKLLKFAKCSKLLNTYVEGIQEKALYNIINPSFLQHGTTSGRYSCKEPNFQNLPKNDKRIKGCIISRPGRVFVGADYSQLEPRVFTSVSQDPKLLDCFISGKDFYSVVGIPMFQKEGCSEFKSDENSFAKQFESLRDIAKQFALATPYGTSAWTQSRKLGLPVSQCETIIQRYFENYPKVELMMLESHEMAKKDGVVYSLYGRPRRIPAAADIPKIYGQFTTHDELDYAQRTLLNLGMNHRVQSSAASIVNRAMIAFSKEVKRLEIPQCWIVLQVHDEVVVECKEEHAEQVSDILKDCMENTTLLPGVKLEAKPVIAKNLKDLK